MVTEAAIEKYIEREAARERDHLAEHELQDLTAPTPIGPVRSTVLESAAAKLIALKFKEFYWTVTRLLGLAFLHDGSRAPPPPPRFETEKKFFAKLDQEKLARAAATRPGRRIYLDVTQTTLCDFEAGIPRVVRKLSSCALDMGGLPVFVCDGRLWTFEAHSLTPKAVAIHPGDVFAIIDQGWGFIDQLRQVMELVRRGGGRNVLLIYDMLPITHPKLFPEGFSLQFSQWVDEVILQTDAVVALAEHGARELAKYALSPGKTFNPAMRLGWRHLGADFVEAEDGPTTPRVEKIAARAPFFLTVSTLEPRKGYAIALDAMERLWSEGIDAQYVIVGRYGWNCQALARRIRTHPELGRRLHWLYDASDADLRGLYRSAHHLIYPSVAEGFGLPIVEAARFGLPVIASDIAVFREICGEGLTYFDAADASSLTARLREALAAPRIAPNLPILTWECVTESLLHMIRDDSYQFQWMDEAVSPAKQIEHPAGAPGDAVSFVTVARDGLFFLRLLVGKLREHAGRRDYEIIVVDRGSSADALEWLQAQPDVRLLHFGNDQAPGHGHGEAAEIGVHAARYERIVLLDSDAFPVDADWLQRTTDRLDERRRLGGAKFVSPHVANPHGWYVHPHFMSFFKSDLGGLIKLRKLQGDDTDTGEEATLRVLAAGYELVEQPIEFYARLDVGRPNIPTIAGGVAHAWYVSRLEHDEATVIQETDGAITRETYLLPLEAKIREVFGFEG